MFFLGFSKDLNANEFILDGKAVGIEVRLFLYSCCC